MVLDSLVSFSIGQDIKKMTSTKSFYLHFLLFLFGCVSYRYAALIHN